MGQQPPPNKKEKSPRRKIDPTIAVALIGLCGTLLTALFASPVLIAWISQSTNPPTVIPTVVPTVIPIDLASMTAPILEPATAPALTSVSPGQDWKSIMSLDLLEVPNSHCPPRLLPPTINPAEDIAAATQQFQQALANNEVLSWLIAPHVREKENGIATLRVSSIATGTQWIELSNELLIDVTAQGGLPEHVNVIGYGECGGTGEIRTFPTFNLTNEFSAYGLNSTYVEADFFTLQPGEFEYFLIPFQCKDIGIYQLSVNVSYVYSNVSNVTDSDQKIGFVCPQSFISWFFDTFSQQFVASTVYRWNGSIYEQTS